MFSEKCLRKHVSIIHAYSMMSALQRKIVNVLLYEAAEKNKNDDSSSVSIECSLSLSKVAREARFNSKNTQYLKEAIDGLASLKIEWNLLKDRAPTDVSFLNLRVLHGSPTFYQEGVFKFSFHKLMLELVENPAIYGTIDLDLQSRFESKYSHSLYENSSRFVNLQKEKTIHVDIFRKMLGVDGDKYKSMREFSRNVLKPAIEEVNDRADFLVNIENIKQGKSIVGFNFSVNEKIDTAKTKSLFLDENLKQAIFECFGEINKTVLQNLLKKYDAEYILEKIHYTKKHAKKEKSGAYPVAYFISACKYDYKSDEEKSNIKKAPPSQSKEFNEWEQKNADLRGKLLHLNRLLDYSKSSDNAAVIDDIHESIQKIEIEFKDHIQLRPSSVATEGVFSSET
jgi:plasmid replication initiation protein